MLEKTKAAIKAEKEKSKLRILGLGPLEDPAPTPGMGVVKIFTALVEGVKDLINKSKDNS